tara:strand:+ start:1183 stop:2277 length:1095 start_codon:yes stop_codon:yes gene_type:complete
MELLSQNYLTLLLITALTISLTCGGLLIKLCNKVFKPEHAVARQHEHPTPPGAGIGFAPLIVLFSLPIVFIDYISYEVSTFLVVMYVLSLAVAFMGYWDDKHDMSAKSRLAIQLIFTAIPVFLLEQVWPGVPYILEKVVLIVGWTWFLNIYNFMDGIDGYVGSHALFVSLVAAWLVPALAPLFLVVSVVMIGYLKINLPMPRAKIFMGDVGSTFLGYILGGLMFASLTVESAYAWSFFTLVMLFTLDATQTIVKRLIRGEKPIMQAHREHWFARMYDLHFTHKKILLLGLSVNMSLLVIVVLTYDNIGRFASPVLGALVFTALAQYVKCNEKKAGIKVPGFNKKDRYQVAAKKAGLKRDGVGQK